MLFGSFSYIDQGDACEGTVSVYQGSQYLTSYTATLTAAQNGRQYCIKARDLQNNHAYKKGTVNVTVEEPTQTALRITLRGVTQNGSVYTFSSNKDALWSFSYIDQGDACEGTVSVYQGSQYLTSYTATLTAAQNGRQYCIKARDLQNNHAYKKGTVNVTVEEPTQTALRITLRGVTQNGSVYTFSSNKDALWSFSYIDQGDACEGTVSVYQGSQYLTSYTATLTAAQNGRQYCIKARDLQNNHAYKKGTVNVTVAVPDAPSIIITSDNREYRASSSGIVTSSWQHVIKSSSACADERDFASSPRSGSSYTVAESAGTDQNGQYVCFRVRGTGTNGIYGYKSTVINVTVAVPDAPSIIITSDNREYRASSSGIVTSSWQHVIKSSSACADERDFASSPRSGSSYTVAESAGTDQNGQYVCFRVRGTGTNGIYGYKSTVINVTVAVPDAPSIIITSDNREYRASSSGIVTSSWQHVIKSSSACADERDFASSPRSGSSYTVAESAGTDQNGQYVCFRVRGTGTNGIYGYKSTVINVTVAVPDAPSIIITSDNREYRASSSGIVTSSWQHVIKSSSACADERDFASSPRSGSSYTVAESAGTDQNGQYVCFRVRGTGTNGIYGYKSTVINVTVAEDQQTDEDNREDTTETGLRVDDTALAGGKQDAAPDVEEIATAGDGEERNWSQLAGYLLVAGAVIGIARVLIIKKYKQMG